jgi:hypothetical protein
MLARTKAYYNRRGNEAAEIVVHRRPFIQAHREEQAMTHREDIVSALWTALENVRNLLVYSEICRHCGRRVSPALMPRPAGYWRGHTLIADCYAVPLKYCPACRHCMESATGKPLKIGQDDGPRSS